MDWQYSETQVRFSWEQLGPLSKQWVMVSANVQDLQRNCKSNDDYTSKCIINDINVPAWQLEYLMDLALFAPGKPYFFKVGGFAVPNCRGGNMTASMMSCQLSQTAPFSLEVGGSRNLTAGVERFPAAWMDGHDLVLKAPGRL